jgi:mitochondrial cardiolipin hydrolase
MSTPSIDLDDLLAQLAATFDDARLSDDEKRSLTHALREASPPEEGLRQLRNRAFDLVRSRCQDPEQLGLLKWLDGVMRALDVGRTPMAAVRTQAHFSPGPACREAITSQLRQAKKSADICVFTITDDRITDEILAALRRGVALRLITDNEKEFDGGSDISRLRDAGVPTVVDRTVAHMHHKFAIFDGTWLLNGSYNWTRSASEYNEENLIVTNDPTVLRQFVAQFQALWTSLQ